MCTGVVVIGCIRALVLVHSGTHVIIGPSTAEAKSDLAWLSQHLIEGPAHIACFIYVY